MMSSPAEQYVPSDVGVYQQALVTDPACGLPAGCLTLAPPCVQDTKIRLHRNSDFSHWPGQYDQACGVVAHDDPSQQLPQHPAQGTAAELRCNGT